MNRFSRSHFHSSSFPLITSYRLPSSSSALALVADTDGRRIDLMVLPADCSFLIKTLRKPLMKI